jgi:hypothetical protein
LRALQDRDTGFPAGHDAENLRGDTDGWHECDQQHGKAGAEFLDDPPSKEEIQSAAHCGRHAENGEVGSSSRGDFIAVAPVTGTLVGRMVGVVDVAFHEVEGVEYSSQFLSLQLQAKLQGTSDLRNLRKAE